ncbi:MAG: Phospho-2-dehydro-3-deoxyheptonate aldolase, Phe-sensitive [Lentisphaerae bacterium ADurb.Bin242]|nr:MAG: Phospho-2-dehydro-3-deoxyheptonate aldolase, Phe-sensitive [Lentisphaerae bacterium ADurb.Bin242]
MAVGFKNGTDGDIGIAIDALTAANAPHSYIGVLRNGHTGIFRTRGNPYCHLVLRGGKEKSNFDASSIVRTKEKLSKAHARTKILIDCSHGNSGKDPRRQHLAFEEALRQRLYGEKAIFGMMLESFLKPGKQTLHENQTPDPEISVTDGCISFEETEKLILRARSELGKRTK